MRQIVRLHLNRFRYVSIHAPTWGATVVVCGLKTQREFQSTHPHGVRLSLRGLIAKIQEFQSTHPHGVRRARKVLCYRRVCFNPRTHMGCDVASTIIVVCGYGFNPRTHMGCDLYKQTQNVIISVSIHAPTWGATPLYNYKPFKQIVSIHAPTWGATAAKAASLPID